MHDPVNRLEERLSVFVWNAVALEGNHYTLDEVATLLGEGVGVPVRVGIAPTKTLAKVAILGAKQNPALEGVCHTGLYEPERWDRILEALHVTDLWGVAGRTAKKLAGMK